MAQGDPLGGVTIFYGGEPVASDNPLPVVIENLVVTADTIELDTTPLEEAIADTNTALALVATETTLAAVLAKIIAAPATAARQDTANTALSAILAKIIAAPASATKQDDIIAALGSLHSDLIAAAPAGENFVGAVGIKAFNVPITPTVTSGPYSLGDIVGGLLTVVAGRVANGKVTLQGVRIKSKAAVTPAWSLHLFSADPSATTQGDNASFALAAADAFKWIATLTSPTLADLGTPNCWKLSNLGEVITTDASSQFYALLVDGTGVTLTSTSDIQVEFFGDQH